MRKIKEIKINQEYIEGFKQNFINLKNEVNESAFYAKSPNKKDHQFNLTFHKNDLLVIDELASLLSVKRSEFIGTLVSRWVIGLFHQMPDRDKYDLNLYIEKLISEKYKHHYQGKTWGWQISEVPPEFYASEALGNDETLITREKNNA